MRNWLLLFFSAFTLGFCLSYLVTTSAGQVPVALNLKVTTDERGAIKLLAGEEEEGASARRHTSLNQGTAGSRISRALPRAYAGRRQQLTTRRAVPIPEAGSTQPPAATEPPPLSMEQGGFAARLLDAARYELAGKTGQRDLILASIFQEVIRTRISEPAAPAASDAAAPRRQPRKPAQEPAPAKEPPAAAPPAAAARRGTFGGSAR